MEQVWLKRGEGRDIGGRGRVDTSRKDIWARAAQSKLASHSVPQCHCLPHLFCITGRAKATVNREPWSLTIKHCNLIAVHGTSALKSRTWHTYCRTETHKIWAAYRPQGRILKTYTTLRSNHNLLPITYEYIIHWNFTSQITIYCLLSTRHNYQTLIISTYCRFCF